MKFGGMSKVSAVDYPGNVVATVFTVGCNFRCAYCQNRTLVDFRTMPALDEDEILDHLIKRKDVLDGICITGGEPSLWNGELVKFIKRVKTEMGSDFLVKVDTNGSNPDFIRKIIDIVDFIALDVKSLDYSSFSLVAFSTILESLGLVKCAKDYEIRITMYPEYIKEKDFVEISKYVDGVKKVAIQQFKPHRTLVPDAANVETYSNEKLSEFREGLMQCVKEVVIR